MAKEKKIDQVENIANELYDEINNIKRKKDEPIITAHFLNDETFAATDVVDWVSTGSSMLDIRISNRPNGGLPVGKIVEIMGLEASGKSALSAHIIKETQKKGGIGIYIDTESALDRQFVTAIGVDLSKMLYLQIETIEDVFETIERLIKKVRESDKDKIVTIVVDTIMGVSTKKEIAGDYDKEGWATDKAIIISRAMRKITNMIGKEKILLVFDNQLRTKLGISFGDPHTTSGGKALGFHSSVRIRLKAAGRIKGIVNDVEQTIGMETKAQVVKNRVGPPLRTAKFDIYFDKGIDDASSWLEFLIDYGIVEKETKIMYLYITDNGEEIKFKKKDFDEKFLQVPELKKELYDKLCDSMIHKYKSENLEEDQIIKTDEVVPNEE